MRVVWWWLGVPGSGAYCACASLERCTHHLMLMTDRSTVLKPGGWLSHRARVCQGVDGETSWHTITTGLLSYPDPSTLLLNSKIGSGKRILPHELWSYKVNQRWGDAVSELPAFFASSITKITILDWHVLLLSMHNECKSAEYQWSQIIYACHSHIFINDVFICPFYL